MQNIYDFPVKRLNGSETTLAEYKGKALIIVNVASQCGFTPQYDGLEKIYRKYREQGLEVLGFPCNQFGGQEPGNEAEIQQFCELRFQVSFPLFAKVDVNGPEAHPLFEHLKKSRRGILGTSRIKWNFTKFLVDRSGEVVGRFAPQTTPESLEAEIVKVLAK